MLIDVEVAYAEPEEQVIIALSLAEPARLIDAISASGLLKRYPQIDLAVNKVGIFGTVTNLDQLIKAGDRVEIYRPLRQHPMEARRRRASR